MDVDWKLGCSIWFVPSGPNDKIGVAERDGPGSCNFWTKYVPTAFFH